MYNNIRVATDIIYYCTSRQHKRRPMFVTLRRWRNNNIVFAVLLFQFFFHYIDHLDRTTSLRMSTFLNISRQKKYNGTQVDCKIDFQSTSLVFFFFTTIKLMCCYIRSVGIYYYNIIIYEDGL